MSSKPAIAFRNLFLPRDLQLRFISNPMNMGLSVFGTKLLGIILLASSSSLYAQEQSDAQEQADAQQEEQPSNERIPIDISELGEDEEEEEGQDPPVNLIITVPRAPSSEAQLQECEDREDAATLSGEIIVCRRRGQDPANLYSGNREEAQARYGRETQNKGAPVAPNAFGIANHGNAISIGSVPEAALIIDIAALPEAPEGSDADRIARGLPPLGQDDNLSEEQLRERSEEAERRRKSQAGDELIDVRSPG